MPLYNFGGSVAPLVVESANVVAQRNGATAQTLYVYNTYTDPSNYARLALYHTGGDAYVETQNLGTGAAENLYLAPAGALRIKTNGTDRWLITTAGNILAQADITYNLGAPGASRPLGVYAGFFGAAITTQAGATYTVAASDSSIIFTSASAVTLTLPAAASFTGRQLQLKTTGGATVASATSNVVARAGGAASTAILAAAAGSWALLQSDGTNWITMAGA